MSGCGLREVEQISQLTKLLVISEGENKESAVYRLNKGDTLHFVCSTPLQSRQVRLFCDHPEKSNLGSYVRFREISWKCDNEEVNRREVCEDLDPVSAAIPIVQAGSFQYYFTVDNESDSMEACSGRGYFLVDPELCPSVHRPPIPLDSVQCLTVLPKLLGPLSRWRNVLRTSHETGYNVVHFTPVQLLNSQSGSAYSLSDQHILTPSLTDPSEDYQLRPCDSSTITKPQQTASSGDGSLQKSASAVVTGRNSGVSVGGSASSVSANLAVATAISGPLDYGSRGSLVPDSGSGAVSTNASASLTKGTPSSSAGTVVPSATDVPSAQSVTPSAGSVSTAVSMSSSVGSTAAEVVKKGRPVTFDDLDMFLKDLGDGWGMASVTDLVLNHTGTDSSWLLKYPHSAYNLRNSPHLRPAYLLDRMIGYLGLEISQGKLSMHGMGPEIATEAQLMAIQNHLKYVELPKICFNEFYLIEVDRWIKCLTSSLQGTSFGLDFYHVTAVDYEFTDFDHLEEAVQIVQDPEYRRNECTVDMDTVLRVYSYLFKQKTLEHMPDEEIRELILTRFLARLETLNKKKKEEVENHLISALDNVLAGMRYRFLDPKGPRIKRLRTNIPLVEPYFTYRKQLHPLAVPEAERMMYNHVTCQFVMAHNGWVMDYDPLKNFAGKDSTVYLRRELVVWGDSIKLHYGEKPSDSPHLWNHMRKYSEDTARLFHGVRLDNCHSTPLHVAEYMLRAARAIRPDLYVIAELFTSNEAIDNMFVNRLGINSLIREALSAWDTHEQGRLVYKYGGQPVGSFSQPRVQVFHPSSAHALFMDMTHDNASPVLTRSVFDLMPTAAFVSMSCCATGSSWGYDQLVPHYIDIVNEKRLYPTWTPKLVDTHAYINGSTGIVAAKRVLNNIHCEIGAKGFTEVYVHDLSSDTVAITRHHPLTHQSVICVARTAFKDPSDGDMGCGGIQPLAFEGVIDKVLLSGLLRKTQAGRHHATEHVKKDSFINGLTQYVVSIHQGVDIDSVSSVHLCPRKGADKKQYIEFLDFPPGSVLIIKVNLYPGSEEALKALNKVTGEIRLCTALTEGLASLKSSDPPPLQKVVHSLTLEDMNNILYHCDSEERSHSAYGVYDLPGHGPFTYAGLQGVVTVLKRVRNHNDLGHPLCMNLRDGDWLLEYLTSRLARYEGIRQFSWWLRQTFQALPDLPRYLIPEYFEQLVSSLTTLLKACTLRRMNKSLLQVPFARALAVGSLEFCGNVRDAGLPKLSPSIQKEYKHPVTGKDAVVSISAGLPHFSVGIMRNWGRDTFISLRGLLLVTGRYQEARAIILAFGGCLRHGLIPNLLGEGRSARYNCRDALWWWLQSVQDYCTFVPQGETILKDPVSMMYPSDDSSPQEPGEEERSLEDTMQEGLQRHAQGISFREKNAGWKIDREMVDEGFSVTTGIDWTTGFVYGGSVHNCGTWMDKMGSSENAGNKGKPATPRNGSAVELVALCASAVNWLRQMKSQGHYKYGSVKVTNGGGKSKSRTISFTTWYALIKRSFEPRFWIDPTLTLADAVEPRPDLINRRDIYKDTVGAEPVWGDYQLRPNYPIAMVVAPDLFTPSRAWDALDVAERILLGPLGMKTLDPGDYNYRADYNNSDDSSDPMTSRGFNYHNGPEWVWPVGYFLRARLIVASLLEKEGRSGLVEETVASVRRILNRHHSALVHSDWLSLPELTNSDGKVCADSCPAQAWSVACMLDVVYDLEKIVS